MNSLLPTEQNAFLVLFNIILIFFIYYLSKSALKQPFMITVNNRRLSVVLMFVFILFSFWGDDWFNYYSSYFTILDDGRTNLENIYYWIIQKISPNYIFFRMIVWGGSLVLFLHMIKRLSIPTDLSLFLFGSIYIIWFSYARATLAMILVYYGITILYKPYKSKIISVILGITVIGCSFFFHKSALFAIIVSLLVILTNKREGKIINITLLFYPIFIIISAYYLNNFITKDIDSIENEINANFAAGQRYLEHDELKRGPGILIQEFLEVIPYYLLIYVSYRYIKSKYYTSCPNDIKAFIRLLFFTVVISSVFSFNLGVNTDIIFMRFLRFAAIPAVVVLSYFIYIGFYSKLTHKIYKIALCGTFYALLYVMYNAFLKNNGLF